MRLLLRLKTPKDILDFLWRRIGYVVIPVFIVGPVGSFLVYKLPAIYSSYTVILVEPQKIDPSFVRNPVTVNIKDRLNQIRNKIISSTNLAGIVKRFGLFEDQTIPLSEQAKIDLLRKRIQIYVDRPGGYETAQVSYFSISFEDKDPRLAQGVTSEVASQFLSEEEKQSKEKIIKTSAFIDSQIEERLTALESRRRELSQARLQSMVDMPLDAATYAKQLDALETEMAGVRESIDRWQEKLLSLERDLSSTPKNVERQVQVVDEASDTTEAQSQAPPPAAASGGDITAIQAEIDRLKRTYTDNHPDVRRLMRQLEALKAQDETNAKTTPTPNKETSETTPVYKTVTTPNPVYRRLTGQMTQVKKTIETQQAKLDSLNKQKVEQQARLSKWPQINQVIADKTAEISSLETEYNGLKAKQQEAKLSVELVNRSQTEQFRIQDPANLPEIPVKPDRPKLYLAVWMVALGIGVGLALARDLTDQTIRGPLDIQMFHTVPMLVSIPTILTVGEETTMRRRHWMLLSVYLLSGAATISLLIYGALNENLVRRVLDYINIYFA